MFEKDPGCRAEDGLGGAEPEQRQGRPGVIQASGGVWEEGSGHLDNVEVR